MSPSSQICRAKTYKRRKRTDECYPQHVKILCAILTPPSRPGITSTRGPECPKVSLWYIVRVERVGDPVCFRQVMPPRIPQAAVFCSSTITSHMQAWCSGISCVQTQLLAQNAFIKEFTHRFPGLFA